MNDLYHRASFLVEGVFSILCEHPYGLTNSELCDHVYTSREPPLWAEGNISSAVWHFNGYARSNRLGLRIRGWGGPGSRYMIYVVRDK
jgi:hypothetical protein